mmetsp:Transcript_21170/g.61576  ORF Transcript_21170/g.61576 Transcript_21170/m.61576 type:complete len:216 (-) Transcript_21170:890-1537(-)
MMPLNATVEAVISLQAEKPLERLAAKVPKSAALHTSGRVGPKGTSHHRRAVLPALPPVMARLKAVPTGLPVDWPRLPPPEPLGALPRHVPGNAAVEAPRPLRAAPLAVIRLSLSAHGTGLGFLRVSALGRRVPDAPAAEALGGDVLLPVPGGARPGRSATLRLAPVFAPRRFLGLHFGQRDPQRPPVQPDLVVHLPNAELGVLRTFERDVRPAGA